MDPKGSDRAPRNGNKFYHKKKSQQNKTRTDMKKLILQIKLGAVGELPILRYGKVTNYEEFKQKLVIYAEREDGLRGTLFRNMQYYTPPLIEEGIHYVVEDFDPENDPLGLHKATLLEEMKARTKLVVDTQTKRTALLALIWGQLSQVHRNLKQGIMQHDDWHFVEPHDGPLAIWQVIMLLWPLVTLKSIETLHAKTMQECDKIHPNH
jgi:hypothetical protein